MVHSSFKQFCNMSSAFDFFIKCYQSDILISLAQQQPQNSSQKQLSLQKHKNRNELSNRAARWQMQRVGVVQYVKNEYDLKAKLKWQTRSNDKPVRNARWEWKRQHDWFNENDAKRKFSPANLKNKNGSRKEAAFPPRCQTCFVFGRWNLPIDISIFNNCY